MLSYGASCTRGNYAAQGSREWLCEKLSLFSRISAHMGSLASCEFLGGLCDGSRRGSNALL